MKRKMFSKYNKGAVLGKGAYGVVREATDKETGEVVAIKKMYISDSANAVRILREIKLLKAFNHPDIIKMIDIVHGIDTVELVFEKMDSDLYNVIQENDDLSHDHYKMLFFQILRGIEYLHKCNVLHRDLKPQNILINTNCKIKLADFGLARVDTKYEPDCIVWSDYVASRWYRAPELCGSFFGSYGPAVDMWAIGCIFAEIILRKPLFPGKGTKDQLMKMVKLLGTPPQEFIDNVRNAKAREWLKGLPPIERVPLKNVVLGANEDELDILERLLCFDPKSRSSASELLDLPIFEDLKDKRCVFPSQELVDRIALDHANIYENEDVYSFIHLE